MTTYHIYIHSNEHPRTINTPKMGRTNYTMFEVKGKDAMLAKVAELRAEGAPLWEVKTNLGVRIWV